MRKRNMWITVIFVLVAFLFASVAMAGEHQYVGATKCKMCHNSAKRGKIYDKWLETAHANAYATLATDEAKKIAGDKGDPQKLDECLQCHVTGHGADAKLLGDKYSVEEGITCEGCHGAGGDYWKMKVMKAITAGEQKPDEVGLVMPDEKTCVACHNEKSPVFKGFDFEKYWAKIEHKVPAAEE